MSKIKDSFDQIHADASMISSTQNKLAQIRQMEEEKAAASKKVDAREKRKKSSGSLYYGRNSWRVACAATMVVVLLLVGQFSLPAKAASYVSIDAIPSLELTLDSKNRVISAQAYNKDGHVILDGMKLKGMSYGDALKSILENQEMKDYLKKDDQLSISFSSEDEKILVDLENKTENVSATSGCHYESSEASHELLEQAHGEKMSFGKYQYYLELKSYDEAVEAEDCHHKSIGQMKSDIESHSCSHDSEGASSEEEEENCSEKHESEENKSEKHGSEENESEEHGSKGHGSGGHH